MNEIEEAFNQLEKDILMELYDNFHLELALDYVEEAEAPAAK